MQKPLGVELHEFLAVPIGHWHTRATTDELVGAQLAEVVEFHVKCTAESRLDVALEVEHLLQALAELGKSLADILQNDVVQSKELSHPDLAVQVWTYRDCAALNILSPSMISD